MNAEQRILTEPFQWNQAKRMMIRTIIDEFFIYAEEVHNPEMVLAYGEVTVKESQDAMIYCWIQVCEILECMPFSMSWKDPEEETLSSMEAILLGLKNAQKEKEIKNGV